MKGMKSKTDSKPSVKSQRERERERERESYQLA